MLYLVPQLFFYISEAY